MKEKLIQITSYFPLYRDPPTGAGLAKITVCKDYRAWGCSIPEIRVQTARERVSRSTIYAVADRYLVEHPEYLIVKDQAALNLVWARNISAVFEGRWSWAARRGFAIKHASYIASFPKDDLLDFNYVLATYEFDANRVASYLRSYRYAAHQIYKKRKADKRYKFLRKLKKPFEWWLNPNNWTGFYAGFALDIYMSSRMAREARNGIWKQEIIADLLPQLPDAITMDSAFLQTLENNDIIDTIAVILAGYKYYLSPWYIMHDSLDKKVDNIITNSIKDIKQRSNNETTT